MFSTRLPLAFLAVTALACDAGLAPGSSAEADGQALGSHDTDLGGTVQIALHAEHEGQLYKLTRATVELSGTATITLRAARSAGSKTMSAAVPHGSYGLYLRPGFAVTKQDAQGHEQPVDAELLSENPAQVSMFRASVLEPRLVFRVAGAEVVFGGAQPIHLSDRR